MCWGPRDVNNTREFVRALESFVASRWSPVPWMLPVKKCLRLSASRGEKVTDKVADAVKERLFRMPAAEPEITEEDLPTYAG